MDLVDDDLGDGSDDGAGARLDDDVQDDDAQGSGSEVARIRRRNGVASAMLAGALFGLRDVLESPKETVAVTVESSGEPTDIDSDGLTIPIDETTTAVAPPQRNSRLPSRRRAPRRRPRSSPG